MLKKDLIRLLEKAEDVIETQKIKIRLKEKRIEEYKLTIAELIKDFHQKK